MNKQNFVNLVGRFILIINLLGLIILSVFVVLIYQKSTKQEKLVTTTESTKENDTCGSDCKAYIDSAILNVSQKDISLPTTSPTSTTKPTFLPTTKPKTFISYIPIAGPATTTSTTWEDVSGTDFNLDLNTNYGSNAKTSWEAFIKVAHNNGQVFARLIDVTHGIVVNGSEISLINNSNLTQVSSGPLSFWSGNNQYRVQLKSLNSFEVTFGSGRVKITY
ncbi:hypothetical protein A2422_04200 [Candidatus Woesebacteria bacterium RIFOXYC1_FULL_31_51]|uniref:Uncharacterized protein n=1 Tax=Candidatus Woesebacteria bacterium GW2011_GWC2_31_9 TaxID=1618586 RepID=A0A0F9YY69_9BACT|nr:MAG: hypothetical protein UR17_C0001G0598 [Candidatus Woesebacteria bacterium GW2011_GWF1_31_35]KKP22788.1 MAG: hypothetical protein UR11_C0002G0168 [Candidatus Woesebacteria bacterium GW2011_GWC1_30_29]KKP26724.1 MAG: hypothetical protein UR13_C0003G0091 [Candidatus Woesebacteria bacterium GW2011_GWD1_31_12]KKP28036.1 MAG: hypothetical protein UR16_C0001G0057 [Candidatus Woesebacteria bacterium GW2011_GWB1_31_29]KKP31421.1 MAG: hypothetical protein UR21_C0009G0002 [Candidatus Woesebacteria 